MKELFTFEGGTPKSAAGSSNAVVARKLTKSSDSECALVVDLVDLLIRHRTASAIKR
jgi:hypothetical protein